MSEMATTLKVRKLMEGQIDGLILAGNRNVEKLEGSEMRESQIRNLVNVAATSKSIEEVTNFIRYQIGRDVRGDTWAHKDFGKAIIADIQTGQVKTALKAILKEAPEADMISVRSDLIALYLGYLNRCFIYASKTDDWSDLGSAPAEGGEGAAHV